MTDNKCSSMKDSMRSALISHLVSSTDAGAMAEAVAMNRAQRQDAIGRVMRDAARKAPMLTISGEPHVYVPDCGIYCRFTWNDLGDALYDAMRELGVKDGDFGKIDVIVKLMMRVVGTKEAVIDNSVVVMSNGVYDTNDHVLKPYDQRFVSVSRVDYPYGERFVSEKWNVFLQQMLPNRDHQKLLQEVLAMAYIDRTKVKLEYLTILKGSGSNGKSVVFGTVLRLLGSDNVSTFSISDLINSKREQNIAACNGKRLNYCSEIRTSEINLCNADAFKALVSGEPMMARSLYKEPFKACNIPILLANANTLPRITDPSMSIQRRIIIIPFDVSVDRIEQDKELGSYIADEISGVFCWVMEGLCRLQNNGYRLSIPADIEDLVSEYVSEYSSVYKWAVEKRFFSRWNSACRPEPIDMGVMQLYRNYYDWCYDNLEDTVSRNAFVRDMTERGFIKKRKADGMSFSLFIGLSEEEVRAKMIEEAIETEKSKGVTDVEVLEGYDGVIRVLGISDVERYLGLVTDSLLYYYRSGLIDGTFKETPGGPLFDVKELQRKLADAGYYRDVKSDGELVKRRIAGSRASIAARFNNEMEMRGLPFFKYSGTALTIPKKYKDKIQVPYDWQFDPDDAERLIRDHYERIYGITNEILNCDENGNERIEEEID